MEERNIVWFDLETTGLSSEDDKIIEISMIKTDPGLNKIDEYHTYLNNEGVPISEQAREKLKNNVSEEELKDKPLFSDKAQEIFEFINGCDLGGYNVSSFDIPFLAANFYRNGIKWKVQDKKIYDSMTLYRKYNPSTLEGVYKKYTGKDLENAHSADADTLAAIDVWKEITKREGTLDKEEFYHYNNFVDIAGVLKKKTEEISFKDIKTYVEMEKKENGEVTVKDIYTGFLPKYANKENTRRIISAKRQSIVFEIGKYKGNNVMDVPEDYINWCINNKSFNSQTRQMLKKIMEMKNSLTPTQLKNFGYMNFEFEKIENNAIRRSSNRT